MKQHVHIGLLLLHSLALDTQTLCLHGNSHFVSINSCSATEAVVDSL